MRFQLSLLLVLSVVALAAGAPEDGAKIKYEWIFNSDVALGLDRTKEMLEEIVGSRPYDSPQANIAYDMLQITKLDCSKNAFGDIDRMKELLAMFNKGYQANIAPFIEHYRAQHFERCHEHLEDSLSKASLKLTSKQREDMEKFANVLQKDNFYQVKAYLELTDSKVASVIASLVHLSVKDDSHFDWDLIRRGKFIGNATFKRRYEQLIGDPCQQVNRYMSNDIENLLPLISNGDFESKISATTNQWLTIGRVCQQIKANEVKIVEEARRRFVLGWYYAHNV